MKVTVERAALLKALGHMQGLVDKRGTIPILSNVLLDASGTDLKLSATDMGLSVIEQVDAEIGEKGATTVSAHTLHDIVRKVPEGSQIELHEDAAQAGPMDLRAGRGHFVLPSLSPEEFPVMTSDETAHRFEMAAPDMIRLIDRTLFAVSTEETRHYLNGIYLHTSGDTPLLRAVATDGHRLAQAEMACPEGAKGIPPVILPRKMVSELRKVLETSDGVVSVALSETKAVFSLERIVVTSKLIDGQFPDYERVIPQGNDKKMAGNLESFAAVVDRVRTISSDRSRAVKISLAPKSLVVSASSSDSGNATEEIDVAYEGDSFEIGFNSQYLLDITDRIQGETIHFDLADSSAPAVVRDTGDDGVLYVLMPMRV